MDNEISSLIFDTEKDPLKIKKCPYCESIYIDEKKCEECGSHFGSANKETFYDIKSAFVDSIPSYKRVYGVIPKNKNFKKYIFKIKNRQKYLLRSFNYDFSAVSFYEKNDNKRHHNFIELRDLIDELASFGIPNTELDGEVKKYSKIPYLQEALKHKVISEALAEKRAKNERLILGIFTQKKLFRLVVLMVIIFLGLYFSSFVNWRLLAI